MAPETLLHYGRQVFIAECPPENALTTLLDATSAHKPKPRPIGVNVSIAHNRLRDRGKFPKSSKHRHFVGAGEVDAVRHQAVINAIEFQIVRKSVS